MKIKKSIWLGNLFLERRLKVSEFSSKRARLASLFGAQANVCREYCAILTGRKPLTAVCVKSSIKRVLTNSRKKKKKTLRPQEALHKTSITTKIKLKTCQANNREYLLWSLATEQAFCLVS